MKNYSHHAPLYQNFSKAQVDTRLVYRRLISDIAYHLYLFIIFIFEGIITCQPNDSRAVENHVANCRVEIHILRSFVGRLRNSNITYTPVLTYEG